MRWAASSFPAWVQAQMPTASAVVADLIDTVVGRTAITFRRLELWADHGSLTESDPASVTGRYYLRFNVADRPAVLAEIAGVLGRQTFPSPRSFNTRPEERNEASCPW